MKKTIVFLMSVLLAAASVLSTGCGGLTSVIIPDSVTTIGENAFGCQWSEKEGDYSKIPGFKIHGYSDNSAAAGYAEENGFACDIVGSEGTKPGKEVK